MKHLFFVHFLFVILLASCQSKQSPVAYFQAQPEYSGEQFAKYWYAGEAEITSFALKQSRYGEIREGTSVMIFVTEPFLTNLHVKADDPDKEPDSATPVMKMNFTRKFVTGIYPYSMMMSVFTPVDNYHFPQTFKLTLSGQEWCGQVFTQLNFTGVGYRHRGFSYFESEGDRDEIIPYAVLEDEIWTRIRLNPSSLPTGDFKIIPSAYHQRLSHVPLETVVAAGLLGEEEKGTREYILNYADGSRQLIIRFESTFPYQILSWKEKVTNAKGETHISEATRLNTIKTAYWQQNSTKYEYLRDSLKLN